MYILVGLFCVLSFFVTILATAWTKENDLLTVTGLFLFIATFGLAMTTIELWSHREEGLRRGLMVQCVGKSGIYWECK